MPDQLAHDYLSTACHHAQHDYCQAATGRVGPKKPAVCKFCGAPCRCECHCTCEKHDVRTFGDPGPVYVRGAANPDCPVPHRQPVKPTSEPAGTDWPGLKDVRAKAHTPGARSTVNLVDAIDWGRIRDLLACALTHGGNMPPGAFKDGVDVTDMVSGIELGPAATGRVVGYHHAPVTFEFTNITGVYRPADGARPLDFSRFHVHVVIRRRPRTWPWRRARLRRMHTAYSRRLRARARRRRA